MLIRKTALLFIPFLLLVFLTGCASTTAPGGWLPTAQETQTETFGAWIWVEYDTDSNSTNERDGEFIAKGEDTVFILSSSVDQDQLTAIPISKIKSAQLTTYNSQSGTIALWTVGVHYLLHLMGLD